MCRGRSRRQPSGPFLDLWRLHDDVRDSKSRITGAIHDLDVARQIGSRNGVAVDAEGRPHRDLSGADEIAEMPDQISVRHGTGRGSREHELGLGRYGLLQHDILRETGPAVLHLDGVAYLRTR